MEAAALLLDPNLSSRCGPKAGDILHQMLYFFRLFSDQCLSHTIENPKFQGYSKQIGGNGVICLIVKKVLQPHLVNYLPDISIFCMKKCGKIFFRKCPQ